MEPHPGPNRIASYGGGLLPLFVLAHFAHHLVNALPIPLLPMIRSDFSLDYTLSGWVISAFNLAYGIGQLPGGWLADRFGARIMITTGVCGVALAGFFLGLSQNFPLLIVSLALMGVLGGGYHPSAPVLISSSVAPGRRGRALGFHMIGGGASFFLAPLIAAAIAAYWGWRGAVLTLSVFTAAYGVFFYLFLKRRDTAAQPAPKRPSPAAGGSQPPAPAARHLTVFILMTTFAGAVLFAAMSFIPLYLVDGMGFSKEKAGAFFAFLYSAGLWVSPLAGYLSDRLGPVRVVLATLLLSGPILYLLNFVSSWAGVGILLLLIGVIIYVRMPVSEAYILSKTPERSRSTVLGIYFFGSMEGGGLLTPVMGYLIDHLGFYYSYSIAGAAMVAGTLICYFFLRGSK